MKKGRKAIKRQIVTEFGEVIEVRGKVKSIRDIVPINQNQKKYLESINNNDFIFCIGPAGTGKSFLSCSIASNLLLSGKVKKVVLCRPVVESGERLGFLPGTFEEKINPYLRPLYDSLNYILNPKTVSQMIEDKIIEVIPLAYMRGLTLRNSLVILDEAQNTTIEQMKMFLTRMGSGSKFLINGDMTQSDLINKTSGLMDARNKLYDLNRVAWIEMTKDDVVRHPTVQKIVEAYEK